MSDLVLNTKKSLYDPIEIEIDGKKYQNRPLSFRTLEELTKYQEAGKAGDVGALYKQITILYGISRRKLRKLDIRDIQKLIEFITNKVKQTTEKMPGVKEDPAKNESRPGAES